MTLFVYYHEYPEYWKDGLYKAIEQLGFDKHNLIDGDVDLSKYDFILGWGGFGSPADQFIRVRCKDKKKGLCIAGNAIPPYDINYYDVLFYETEWYRPQIEEHKNIVHAFGVNTDIYKETYHMGKTIDYLTVGSFSNWKRQGFMLMRTGKRLAIGEIQRDNREESMRIIEDLLDMGVMVSGMIEPEELVNYYNTADTVYIPADINGGGERAILEARACGCKVEIENDNPKLKELLDCPVWDHNYYADQLKKGIDQCK